MLDAVNDHPCPRRVFPGTIKIRGKLIRPIPVLLHEDNVAVLSHKLHNQPLAAQISHLIQMFDVEMDDSFKSGLSNIGDSAVLKMLAQEHAKARSRHGAGFIALCEINQGQGCPGRDQKASLTAACCFYGKQQLVIFRLGNLINAPACQGVL